MINIIIPKIIKIIDTKHDIFAWSLGPSFFSINAKILLATKNY